MLCRKKLLYFKARMAGNNITRSAILAGCSEKTASQAGSRMEKDREVVAAYARAGGIPEKVKAVKTEPKPKEIKAKPVAIKKEKTPNPVKVSDPVVGTAVPDPIVEEVFVKHKEPPKNDPMPTVENSLHPVDDPIEYFKRVTNDWNEDPKLRLDAAKAWATFTVNKPGEKGKKEQKEERARQAASKFTGLRSVK